MKPKHIILIAAVLFTVDFSHASSVTWQNAAGSSLWSTSGNWSGAAPVNGDDLIFTDLAGAVANQPLNNDFAALTARSLTFRNATFDAPLTVGGNALSLSGTGLVSGASISRTTGNSLATVTLAAHGLVTGQVVTITGASTANLNGTFTITVLDANTFTYTSSATTEVVGNTANFTLAALVNTNTTAGRGVTIGNGLAVTAAQTWSFAADADAVTILNGNLTGSGDVTIAGGADSNLTTLPVLRLGGNNIGYTGTITTAGSDSKGLLLLSPTAMTGGLIDLNNGNRNLWLTSGSTYTFGIDGSETTGGRVKFRGTGLGGLFMTGGDVTWNPGGATSYAWSGTTGTTIDFAGSNESTPRTLNLGSTGTFTVSGASKTFRNSTGGNNPARVTLLSSLADGDEGTARSLSTSLNLLKLTQPATNISLTNPLRLTLSGGNTAISHLNQLPGGNLNIGGGTLILDNIPWNSGGTGFANVRSNGTGNGQFQFTANGGIAARGTPLVIDSTQTTASTFNLAFKLGSGILGSDGLLYANAPVKISQDITFDNNRAITVAGGATLSAGVYSLTGPIHELSGALTGSGGTRNLTFNGGGNVGNASGLGVVRLSSTGNAGLNISTAADAITGFGILIATDDAAFGGGTVTINSSTPGGQSSGWMVLFEGSKTFSKSITYNSAAINVTGSPWGLGAYSGNVVYTGTATMENTNATANSSTPLVWQVEGGASLELGITAGTAATFTNNMSAGNRATVLRKNGPGIAILKNVTYNGTSSATSIFEINNGVLRETGNSTSNSTSGKFLRFGGGILESSGTLNRAVSGTVNPANVSLAAGGGFAAFGGPLIVDLNVLGTRDTLQWNAGSFVGAGNPFKLGSATADNVVEFQDNINLTQSGNLARAIQVEDNPLSSADKAIISGVISGATNSGLEKTGNGILELTGDNTYATGTTVTAGTLRVNNASGSGTGSGAVGVASGATIGGTGTISNTVTLASGADLNFVLGTPAGSHDKLDLNALVISGTTTVVVSSPGGAAPGLYVLATASGGITGAPMPAPSLPDGWAGTVFVDGTDVKLNLTSTGGGDTTPPVWTSGWPTIDGIADDSFTLRGNSSEDGTAYYVVFPNNATAPSSAEVKAGTTAGGGAALASGNFALTADSESTSDVTGLTLGTSYDVYVVAEDNIPNLQPSPTKLDVTTTGGSSAYDTWAGSFPGFTNTAAGVDFENDGVKNLLEFVLGGNPTTNDTPPMLPTVTASGTDLVLTFKRSDVSELQPVTVKVQLSADLVTWNPADDITIGAGPNGTGPNGASYTVAEGPGASGLDTIIVTIPKAAAAKKFARVVAID